MSWQSTHFKIVPQSKYATYITPAAVQEVNGPSAYLKRMFRILYVVALFAIPLLIMISKN